MTEHDTQPFTPPPGPAPDQPPPVSPAPAATPPVVTPAAGHGRRGAVLWGVTLIAVGGLLLVSQFVPGIALWRYWPLIIIALGVRQTLGPASGGWSIKHGIDGLVTVAIGLVFLGQMLGYLGWNVWLNILRLWPLLLVALGIEIAGKGMRSEWVRAFGGVVVIGGLAYGALVMTPTSGTWLPIVPVTGSAETFSEGAAHNRDVAEGTAVIRGGVGRLRIEAGDDLVTAAGRSPFEPTFDVSVTGRKADVEVGLGAGTWVPTAEDIRLDVTLDDTVVWDLTVDAGVTQYTVDARELRLSALHLASGVSDGTLVLGSARDAGASGAVSVKIQAGVSALTVRVPSGDPVRVSVSDGLSGVDARGDWTQTRGSGKRVYESDGFRGSRVYWDIEIESGVGGITIEYY